MKIIHVAQFLGVGGLEKIIYHLALEQKAQGHEVEVYIYDELQTWVDFFRKSGISVVTPKLKSPGYDRALLKRMKKDLFGADIIHSHDLNPLMYLGPLKLWSKLTMQKSPRLIHTTHGLDHVTSYPRGKLYQQIFSRMADKIIAVSEKIGKFYLEEIKLSSKKVRVIPNGIATFQGEINDNLRRDKKMWLAQRHQLDHSRPIALSLSRVVPLKDQLFLINAFKKRPDLQLLIVGPSGDDAYYEVLKKHEDQNIRLVGAQELVSEYNLGSDIYVSASTHEGIPVAVLEAMTVQTPCLVSDIPGHKTLIEHGDCLMLYGLHQEEDFLSKLDSFLKNLESEQEKAARARKIVENYYSVKIMVKNYLEEYEGRK